jgi:general L-amino acid transport system permease protein
MGRPLEFDFPVLKGFNFKGGMVIRPEFIGMLLGLSIYTAAFISETVRSGIISVSKGQKEASQALGLKSNLVMRLIIIPQALRVIIPPLTSQYLNLTKNSSLGIAIGYADLVHGFGGISLNQTGRAIEIISMVMLTYLTISLIISLFMNLYNKSVQFKGNA